MTGIEPPKIEMLYAKAGTVPGATMPIPVVRVTFPEGVFFNTNADDPIPSALPVISLIAENMARDVPDAALTIIGNTDSTGTEAYNDALSERRALHAMQLLAEDGVDPLQMTTVAIGDRQPVAPNSTAEGRALNRRVEFLISASPQANLSVIQYQHVNEAYLSTGTSTLAPTGGNTVSVLQAHSVNIRGAQKLELVRVGPMQIERPSTLQEPPASEEPLAPAPTVQEKQLTPIEPAKLNNVLVSP